MIINRRFALLPTTSALFQQQKWIGRKLPKPGKPPIEPPVKSKLYQIFPAKWVKPEDVADLLWRRHVYNNAVKSMRRLFRDEYEQQKEAVIGIYRARKDVEDELNRLIEHNDHRNRELGEKRAEREKETFAKLEEETLREIENRIDKEAKNVEEKEAEILKMIEQSNNFITKENMEEKILQALESPVNLEYAVDLNGLQIPNPIPEKYFGPGIKTGREREVEDNKKFIMKKVGTYKATRKGLMRRENKEEKKADEEEEKSADKSKDE